MNVIEVHEAASRAAERARNGGGPSFLICDTYRSFGHHVGDAEEYRTEAERQLWQARDPIPKLAKRLNARDIAAITSEAEAAVKAAADKAKAMPMPAAADAKGHAYAD